MSLRARLLLGMAVVAAVLVVSALAITRSTRDHLLGQVDDQLRAAIPRVGDDPARQALAPRLSELYVGRVTTDGRHVAVLLPDLEGEGAPLPQIDAGDVDRLARGAIITVPSDGDTRYRLAGQATASGGVAVVGLSLDDVDAAFRRLVVVESVALLSALGVLALVTWWVIRLGVRPVRQMTATASAIAAGDLSLRVPPAEPGTEAGELSSALNGMLGHIEAAFEERAAADVRLRRFVADASHELRTPVTTIRGYAELYRDGALPAGPALDEAMRRTEAEAVRMGRLVDDLLHLARLDQGRPLERAPVDLAALAADAVADARAAAPDREVVLDAPAPAVVVGDEHRLRQVVGNLVTNALVHAPGAAVSVRVAADGETATLSVTDDGPGMSEADAARAFERFYRADASRSRHQGGSGLGLSIVEATVRAHGGSVALRSAPGAGTTVQVRLPVVRGGAVSASG
ncbi:MAG TPA: HAMP domain-containing sensor histidine kinase [Acidimicrobiales bacterium]|nr:HAMP domain-containing sensor histidine kinase [Acidimicrobiales bacterium]